MNRVLYSGIKNLLRCDEAETVAGIARYVISQHRALRVVSRFVEITRHTPIPAVLTLLAWIRSYLSVCPNGSLAGIAWIARLSNERRAIEPFIAAAPELPWTELKFQPQVSLRDAFRVTRKNFNAIPRVYRIARRMHARYESFKAMRVIELLGYYSRYVEIFSQASFCLAVTSNHSNPHGIAFTLAAQKCGVPVALISHGMPVRPVARLYYDLAVVHSTAAAKTYRDEGCRIDQIFVHGRKQHYVSMQAGLSSRQFNVGIFLCKDVNEQRLKLLVDNLLANERVTRILIRPHPKNLWRGIHPWIAARNDARLSLSSESTIPEGLKGLNVVFGGNSSVLIESVTAGIPSAYVDALDYGSPDLHRFVAAGLIYRSDIQPDLEAIARFYENRGWSETLKTFANIDEDEATVQAKTLNAIADRLKPRDVISLVND